MRWGGKVYAMTSAPSWDHFYISKKSLNYPLSFALFQKDFLISFECRSAERETDILKSSLISSNLLSWPAAGSPRGSEETTPNGKQWKICHWKFSFVIINWQRRERNLCFSYHFGHKSLLAQLNAVCGWGATKSETVKLIETDFCVLLPFVSAVRLLLFIEMALQFLLIASLLRHRFCCNVSSWKLFV